MKENTQKYHKLVIGLQPDKTGNESYSDRWAEALKKFGAKVHWLDLLGEYSWEEIKECDGVMWRWMHNPNHKRSARAILYAIEHNLGIPVFPDSSTSWHYDEKIWQHFIFKGQNIPSPDAWLFWNREDALHWAKQADYPVVFKLSTGAGSTNVKLISTVSEAETQINKLFTRGIFPYLDSKNSPNFKRRLKHSALYLLKGVTPPLHSTWWRPEFNYAYFQEYIPGNEFDTRITVIGNRAFGYRRFNRPEDFRASGSGLVNYDTQEIDLKCVALAFKISENNKFQSMAYDFIFKDGKPVITEISYTFVDHLIYECPGHWNPSLEWMPGNLWPEEVQVQDFLEYIVSRKPES